MGFSKKCLDVLQSRGVTLDDIVDLVVFLQGQYIDNVSACLDEIRQDLIEILDKREVYHAVMTGIALDIAVDQRVLFDQPLSDSIQNDYGLFGVDEVIAYGIVNLYGSIAMTNFGYIDKVKPGIIGKVNDDHSQCNTFLDDILGALAASGASKFAHTHKNEIIEKVIEKKKKKRSVA